MTDILARLRSETCSEHEAVERQLGLVDATLTLAHYRRRLEQFWGFYAPLEARLEAGAGAGPGAPILVTHRKTGWIEADLRALGMARPETLPTAIRSFVESAGEEDAIVAAALGTFRSLRTWCDESAVAP